MAIDTPPTPPTAAAAGVVERIEQHLLDTVGVAPAQASARDLMNAVSQVARTELSRRWVAEQARERDEQLAAIGANRVGHRLDGRGGFGEQGAQFGRDHAAQHRSE